MSFVFFVVNRSCRRPVCTMMSIEKARCSKGVIGKTHEKQKCQSKAIHIVDSSHCDVISILSTSVWIHAVNI